VCAALGGVPRAEHTRRYSQQVISCQQVLLLAARRRRKKEQRKMQRRKRGSRSSCRACFSLSLCLPWRGVAGAGLRLCVCVVPERHALCVLMRSRQY
jgi:hypothetical protein